MDIFKITHANAQSADDATLVTLATNPVDVSGDALTCHVTQIAAGALSTGTKVGGDHMPTLTINPKYIGKAVAGARVAGVTASLDWIRANCSAYEWTDIQGDGSRGAQYLFSGVLNVTTDESYNPFASADAGTGVPSVYAVFAMMPGEMFEG